MTLGEEPHRRPAATARAAGGPASRLASRVLVERLFAAHHAMIWRIARRCGLSSDQATKITEQTFRVAVSHRGDLDPENERTFLVSTALKLARARLPGTGGPRRQSEDRLSGAGIVEVDEIALLDCALGKLERELLEVFVLFELEGLSLSDISAVVELPLATTSSRLQSARQRFRQALGELLPSPGYSRASAEARPLTDRRP